MNKLIEEKVHSCHSGLVHQNMQAAALTHPQENTTPQWVRMHLDFAGPFMAKIFLILDSYAKWIEVYLCWTLKYLQHFNTY